MASAVIDVISDTVCPWCFVGKRRLERALQQWKGREYTVRWHPYQLNPNFPPEAPANKLAYYQQKFGEERTQQMAASMAETFAAEGLAYTMSGETGNSLASHRLIAAAGAQGPGVQDRLVEALFRRYFSEGQYINDPAVLKAAALEAGLENGAGVVDNPKAFKEEVGSPYSYRIAPATLQVERDLRELAQRNGVSGVPFFIIGGRYALSGAQDPAAFLRIFETLEKAP